MFPFYLPDVCPFCLCESDFWRNGMAIIYHIYIHIKYSKHIKFFTPHLAFRFLGIPVHGSQRYSYTGTASNILLYLIVDQDAGSVMFSLSLLFWLTHFILHWLIIERLRHSYSSRLFFSLHLGTYKSFIQVKTELSCFYISEGIWKSYHNILSVSAAGCSYWLWSTAITLG